MARYQVATPDRDATGLITRDVKTSKWFSHSRFFFCVTQFVQEKNRDLSLRRVVTERRPIVFSAIAMAEMAESDYSGLSN